MKTFNHDPIIPKIPLWRKIYMWSKWKDVWAIIVASIILLFIMVSFIFGLTWCFTPSTFKEYRVQEELITGTNIPVYVVMEIRDNGIDRTIYTSTSFLSALGIVERLVKVKECK